jgi:plastocyanin
LLTGVTTTGVLMALAPPAGAEIRTYTLRHGPIEVGAYETVLPRGWVRTPRVDGHIVRMHARVVDRRGRPVTVRDVMLHHVWFSRRWRPAVKHECQGARSEVFYGTGEEDQQLRLPAGYGYRVRATDRWRMASMLMSHVGRVRTVYLQYRVTVDTRSGLTPVRAFWLRANGCGHPGYFINGGGAPGSTTVTSTEWRVPYDLKIVAVGGHLHGGARDMWLSQARCGDRRLLDNRPSYGMPDHIYYRARPILHEPGPVDTRYFMSRTGVVAKHGEVLRISAAYDAEHPQTAMAVMHLYVARVDGGSAGCAPLPADGVHLTKAGPTRADPPHTRIQLIGLDAQGRTRAITESPWPVTPLGDGAEVELGDAGFNPPHVSLASPGAITWRATGAVAHNVRLAEGPRLVATPSLDAGSSWTSRFSAPGRYTLFCTRHPVSMHAFVDVSGQPSLLAGA